MKTLTCSRRLLYLLLGGLAVLLGACASHAAQGPTTGVATSPTATATQGTAISTLTASPPKLTVVITCGGTKQNGYGMDVIHGKVCAQTMPAATLTIQVFYCGKPDPSSVLQGSVMADSSGFYQWNWTPQPDCQGQPIAGWEVTVTAQLNGQTAHADYRAIYN